MNDHSPQLREFAAQPILHFLGQAVDLADRTIRIEDQVKGEIHLAVQILQLNVLNGMRARQLAPNRFDLTDVFLGSFAPDLRTLD